MPDSIDIDLSDFRDFSDWLKRFSGKVPEVIKDSFSKAFDLIGMRSISNYWVTSGKSGSWGISGWKKAPTHPSKLTVRTGRLIRSIAPQGGAFFQSSREQIRRIETKSGALKGIFGTRVPYAGRHEYGGTFVDNVRAHSRHITQAWGRPIEPRDIQVRAHSRTVNVKKRPFLRPALFDVRDKIVEVFADGLETALEETE